MPVWVEAARPRTLPAAVVPVLVGTAAAARPVGELDWLRAGLALLVALALQVAVNYANDLFDGIKGVDTEARTGPRRAVASGLATPEGMRNAMVVAVSVAAVGGLALAALVGWELLLVGLVAILAALGYSGGRRPYASMGLGEVSVFVFFGLVATIGSQYVQDEALGLTAALAAVPVGAVATALLVVNNLRDIPTDELAGKRTLAVRLGEQRTVHLFTGLVWSSVAIAPLLGLPGEEARDFAPLVALLAVPLAGRATGLVHTAARSSQPDAETMAGRERGPTLIAALEATARYQLSFGVLLALGLALAGS
jgi:1,4-dihydroxy-2-naphthoate polyprenyltransferase